MSLAAAGLPAGTYSDEEEVYFAKEAGRAPPPWVAVVVDKAGWRTVDAYGAPVAPPSGLTLTQNGDGIAARFADGRTTVLRAARPATCWASVRKETPKADGTEDWSFHPGLQLHDQGGRVRAGDKGAQPVVLRMRNVVWPSGNNRPSLVLYIHKPDSPDRADSYAWADPGAARIGINLRWMQASCTIDGREAPTPALKGEAK